MEKKRKEPKAVTTSAENKEYLRKIFVMYREIETSMNAQRHEKYNNTEIRLMNELVYAASSGERLISTQLADRLCLTRSAVSQIVGKLEKEGVVRRVADAVDRKIAYIELTEETSNTYKEVIESYSAFVGKVVAYMGVSKMEKLLSLTDEFFASVTKACEDMQDGKKA